MNLHSPRLVDRHGILQCRYELHSPVHPTAICPYSMRLAEFRGVLSISPEWNHNDRPTENLWKGKGWPIEIKNLVASALNSSFIKHVVRSAGSRKTFRQ